MKLRTRIFCQLLVVTLLTFWLAGAMLLWQQHNQNVRREHQRSQSEFSLICDAISPAFIVSSDAEAVVNRYNQRQSGWFLVLYQPDLDAFSLLPAGSETACRSMITVQEGQMAARILPNEQTGVHTIYLSAVVQGNTLIYSRSIENIYEAENTMLRNVLLASLGMAAVLAIVCAVLAQHIVTPVVRMQKAAFAAANGDYSVRLPEGNDELGALAADFNRMTAAVQERKEQLEQRIEERQLFIDNLAHEMNTPLTSIQGYADYLLQTDPPPEQRHQALTVIRSEAARMAHMREELYTLTVLRSQTPVIETVQLQSLLDHLQSTIGLLCAQEEVRYTARSAVDSVETDRDLLTICLVNLLHNAVRYAPKGRVSLRVLPKGEQVVFAVADNGCGIEKEQQQKIFDAFYRVDKSRSRKTGGTGLGLALCKQIADVLGGELAIASVVGQGSIFTLTLPRIYNSDTTLSSDEHAGTID